ncbi:MAG: DUF6384 family protein [Hyphomicrobiaceae bacterium]|nr:DUF6384 family protein [Hyphomicrobiaceae bacterium]
MAAPATTSGPAPLDDVMIAMDVVDTLRHDERLVDRELNEVDRRKALIERLREIYRGQGIDVPDRILEEGVAALEADRFVYKPPRDGLQARLARLYVSRGSWGLYLVGALAGLAALAIGNFVVFEWPAQKAAEDARIELAQILPQEIDRLSADITVEAKVAGIAEQAAALALTGRNAAKAGDRATAQASRDDLKHMLSELRAAYTIRIVSRRGELTGLWRIPKANPDAYNYYLVVEAIGRDGKVIPQTILNEETGQRDTVQTWAVRVPRDVLSKVEADKKDDGIVQAAEVGRKTRGRIDREWSIAISGGMITRW